MQAVHVQDGEGMHSKRPKLDSGKLLYLTVLLYTAVYLFEPVIGTSIITEVQKAVNNVLVMRNLFAFL